MIGSPLRTLARETSGIEDSGRKDGAAIWKSFLPLRFDSVEEIADEGGL